jgi:hypothetical protein
VGAPNHSRWLDRIVAAAIGAGVMAWWTWPRATEHGDAIAQSDVAPIEVPHEPAPVEAPARQDVAVAAVAEAPVRASEAVPVVAAPIVATPIEAPIEAPTSEATPSSSAPVLPLPRMPGDTRLSSSSRFDEESASWIVKAAYRVVAREHHVVAFYRKALTDQGLTVTHSQAQPAADGSVKTYLHGKSGRVHAQVGIAPRTDTLETRVWILWRTRA